MTAKQWAITVGLVVAAIVAALFVGRSEGAAAQRTADDTKKAVVATAREDSALKTVAVLRDSVRTLAKRAAATVPAHIAAQQRTDSAGAAEVAAREAAEQVAHDANATADTLRANILRLAYQDSIAYRAVVQERDASNLRISADEAALREAVATIAADSSAAVLAKQALAAKDVEIADLHHQLPSPFEKVVRAVGVGTLAVLAFVIGHSLK